MYVLLVNDDDTIFGSHKERLMQRQKLVNELVFIVDPIYRKTHDMTNASVVLEYVLPVSREYKTVNLVLSEERYKDYFLQYKLAFDTDLSSQAGALEMQLTFLWTELDARGRGIQRVRKTSSTFVDIIPVTAWSDIVPDPLLSAIDQRIIKLDASMRAMNDYMNILEDNKVDNLVHNESEDTLYLTSQGKLVGDKIPVKNILDDGIPVVDLDSTSGTGSGGSNSGSNNDCNHDDHDCHDNVVEFGYNEGYNPTPEKPEDDDSNVVEF